jgi:hypothetical protein
VAVAITSETECPFLVRAQRLQRRRKALLVANPTDVKGRRVDECEFALANLREDIPI